MKKILLTILIGTYLLACNQKSKKETKEKTNFIIVLADDMGFSDPGCFGGEISTPNIDKLAFEGLRFTNFYNSSRCSPTRASILSGKYPHEVGLHRNGRSLKDDTPTLAEILVNNGYNTGMIGKWHLSKSSRYKNKKEHQKWLDHQIDPEIPFGPIETYPVNRGFQKHYGVIWGVVDYFDPFSLVNGTEAVKEVSDDFYITRALNDSAVAYVEEFSKSEKPFFLYLAHTAPHWPLHALDEDIAKYKDKYDKGWNAMRQSRFKKQVELGLFKEDELTLPPVMGENWESLNQNEKEFQSSKMEAHAAMVDRIDQGLGRLIRTLKETGEFENTVILFMSDNGASPETPVRPGYDRSSMTREGKKIKYKDGFPYAGPETTYAGIGRAWANAANTPFRYWKKESFEGGNHTPMIIHWAQGITQNRGGFVSTRGHAMDILPTFLDIAGIKYPQFFNNKNVKPASGKSLLPAIDGYQEQLHDALYFEHVNGRAIIKGKWKLVSLGGAHNKFNDFKKWELYNLNTDPTETNNVIEQNPEITKRLSEKWEEWWKDYQDLR